MLISSTMWASMAAWFTPTLLFCLLNLMIATIFIASNLKSPHHDSPRQLTPPPSLLERVKSVDLYSFYTTTPQYSPGQLARAPSLLERVKSIDFSSFYPFQPEPERSHNDSPGQLARAPSMLDNPPLTTESEQLNDSPGQLAGAPSLLGRVKSFKISDQEHHVIRSKSDKAPAKNKMKKSLSQMRFPAVDDGEEDVDRRRPATMREVGTASFRAEDGSVDAKADDFINRFKQQLKLQRLDSLLRYKEMLNRGTSSK